MTPAEVAACNRLSEPARTAALEAFAALDELSATVDAFCADVRALTREADGLPATDDVDAEWASLQRKVDGREIRQ